MNGQLRVIFDLREWRIQIEHDLSAVSGAYRAENYRKYIDYRHLYGRIY